VSDSIKQNPRVYSGSIKPAVTSCKGCGAKIIYLPTRNNSVMPIDVESYQDGDEAYLPKKHVSHFTTCPKAKDFSHKNAKSQRQDKMPEQKAFEESTHKDAKALIESTPSDRAKEPVGELVDHIGRTIDNLRKCCCVGTSRLIIELESLKKNEMPLS